MVSRKGGASPGHLNRSGAPSFCCRGPLRRRSEKITLGMLNVLPPVVRVKTKSQYLVARMCQGYRTGNLGEGPEAKAIFLQSLWGVMRRPERGWSLGILPLECRAWHKRAAFAHGVIAVPKSRDRSGHKCLRRERARRCGGCPRKFRRGSPRDVRTARGRRGR